MAATREAIDAVLAKLHWLGHDCFRLDGPRGPIYWDPFKLQGGPTATLILVSHAHYDHCAPEDVAKVQTAATVVVTEPQSAGKLSGQVLTLAPGQELMAAGYQVEAVPAYNTNKDFHPKANQWLGFIVTVDGVRIYHAGDTDHIPEMKDMDCDVALLPVSGTYVMTAAEAVAAARDIHPQVAIPMHYGAIVGQGDDAQIFAQGLAGSGIVVSILPKE